jgi:isochorismate pyruvate lyase
MNPKECTSLQDVRNEIDKIDLKIVDLMALRNTYIKQLARFKDSVDKIKEQSRIDDVINRVRAHGIEQGLSPNLIEEIFHIMINNMVETEIAEFRNIKAL